MKFAGSLALCAALFAAIVAVRGLVPRSLAAGEGPELDARLTVRASSRLLEDGRLEPGRVLSAEACAGLPVLRHVSSALAAIPPAFAPARVTLEHELQLAPGVPRILGVECHRESGSLLLGDSAAELPRSVWLHELAHVRLHGARPRELLAKRVITAFEEGVADDYAAVFSGSSRLGFGAQQRDLAQRPNVGPSDWASLAFPDFDPHRMGWALGAALYAAEPRAGALLESALACLDGPGPLADAAGPTAAISSLLASCPESRRALIFAVLAAWLPPAFLNESNPP